MADQPITAGTVLMHQVGTIGIQAAGYDHTQHALIIHFNKSNEYAVFTEVPIDVWQDFMQSDSKNRYYNTYIRDCYPAARAEVKPLPPEA